MRTALRLRPRTQLPWTAECSGLTRYTLQSNCWVLDTKCSAARRPQAHQSGRPSDEPQHSIWSTDCGEPELSPVTIWRRRPCGNGTRGGAHACPGVELRTPVTVLMRESRCGAALMHLATTNVTSSTPPHPQYLRYCGDGDVATGSSPASAAAPFRGGARFLFGSGAACFTPAWRNSEPVLPSRSVMTSGITAPMGYGERSSCSFSVQQVANGLTGLGATGLLQTLPQALGCEQALRCGILSNRSSLAGCSAAASAFCSASVFSPCGATTSTHGPLTLNGRLATGSAAGSDSWSKCLLHLRGLLDLPLAESRRSRFSHLSTLATSSTLRSDRSRPSGLPQQQAPAGLLPSSR